MNKRSKDTRMVELPPRHLVAFGATRGRGWRGPFASAAAVLAFLVPGTMPSAAAATTTAGAVGCTPKTLATGFHEHQVNADQAPIGAIPDDAETVPWWLGAFTTDGVSYPFAMVGNDPSTGLPATVPVVLVPIRLEFAADGCVQDDAGMAADVAASPLFSPSPFRTGTTQYPDAFQRGNFWSAVNGGSPDYHVLLDGPQVLPTQTLQVPAAQGLTAFEPVAKRPCGN